MTAAVLNSSGQMLGSGICSVSAGVSEAAERVAGQLKRVFMDGMRTASGQSVVLPVHAALREGYEEAMRLAPHGEQALPSPGAIREADELLAALPQWCVAPTNSVVEPSGAISFEWDLGPNRWVALAVKGTGTIEHSAMLGLGNEQWGTRNFAGTLDSHGLRLLSELMRAKD